MLPIASLTELRASGVALLSSSFSSSIDPQSVALIAATIVAVLSAALWLRSSQGKAQLTDNGGNPIQPRHVPSLPGTLPILGDLLTVAPHMDTYHSWLLDTCKRFDFEPWSMKMPGQAKMFLFSSPEQFDEVLANQFDNFPKGEYHVELLTTFFGKSLVGSDGARWYHQRKIAVKFFTARTLRAYMATSAKRNLIQVMDIIAAKQAANVSVNLTTLLQDFTMQTFVETGLGVKLDWIGRETPHPFQHAIDRGSALVANRFRRPTWFWKLQQKLRVGEEGELAAHMVTITGWLTDVVNKSLAASAAKSSGSADARDKEDEAEEEEEEEIKSMVELFAEQSREDAEGLHAEDLVDFIQVMVIAARDTTAIALTWFFYELHKNPHVAQTIRTELATLFPGRVGKQDTYFTPEDARSLVYMEAALKEALRLHPPGAFMFREVLQDTVICDDILMRKGELAGLSCYSAARNPHVWGPDASQYNPARWINPQTGELQMVPSAKFATFSAGPRACIGMNLAMLELRVVAANLLSRFRFELDTELDGSYTMAALLAMKQPIVATVHAPAHAASASTA